VAMIDKTRLVVVLGNKCLTPWMEAFASPFRVKKYLQGFDREEADAARNAAIAEFLDSPEDWLVMANSHAVPDERTLPLLETQEPIASVRCPGSGKGKKIWEAHPSTFSALLWRAHRTVLATMKRLDKPPWFGRDKNTCPCRWFYDKCVAEGFQPAKVGEAGRWMEDGSVFWLKKHNYHVN